MQPACYQVPQNQGPRGWARSQEVPLEPVYAISTSGRPVKIRHMRRIWAVIGTFRNEPEFAVSRNYVCLIPRDPICRVLSARRDYLPEHDG
jgi:hypothetical protein